MPANGVEHEEPRPDLLERRQTAADSVDGPAYDRYLYGIFYAVTLEYARRCPSSLRRLMELTFLFMAVFSFVVLVFVHVNFGRTPAGCLDHVKDTWPRDGVLRVEVIRDWQRTLAQRTGTLSDLYSVDKSYEREYKFRPAQNNHENASILLNSSTKTNDDQDKGDFDIEPSSKEFNANGCQENCAPKCNFSFDNILNSENVNERDSEKKEIVSCNLKKSNRYMSKSNFFKSDNVLQFCSTKYSNSSIRGAKSEVNSDSLIQSSTTVSPTIEENHSVFHDIYIVEYSFDEVFLSLSQNARNRLGIPVMFVPLEPTRHKCFGDSMSRIFLEYLLGYDNILMSSVVSLAQNEHYKGRMRNVNTNSYYIFVNQKGRTLYIASFFVMVVFAVLISKVLRFGQHRVFFIIVHLLQRPLNDSLVLPTAQLFVVVLALFSIGCTMLNFFKGNTKGLWIVLVLIIWVAEQYDTICSHCWITKKHWLKFFYLYLFSFFAYHCRFNGEYSYLALICSWFFIQHSMLFFYHRYELPIMVLHDQLIQESVRRDQLQQQLLQQQQQLQQRQHELLQHLAQLKMTFQRREATTGTTADDSETTVASAAVAEAGAASSDSSVLTAAMAVASA